MASDESTGNRIERSPVENESVGLCVVRAVANAKGVDPGELPVTLNEVVDPDALERIFAPRPNGAARRGGELSFVLAGCGVTVAPGRIVVRTERRA